MTAGTSTPTLCGVQQILFNIKFGCFMMLPQPDQTYKNFGTLLSGSWYDWCTVPVVSVSLFRLITAKARITNQIHFLVFILVRLIITAVN